MSKDLEAQKNELAKAACESGVPAASCGAFHELTDEEAVAIFGGQEDAEAPVGMEAPPDCPGSIGYGCPGRECSKTVWIGGGKYVLVCIPHGFTASALPGNDTRR